jgi:hypothetical protein
MDIFFKRHNPDYKIMEPCILVYLNLLRQYQMISGNANNPGKYSLEDMAVPVSKLVDDYRTKLNHGDLSQLGNISMVLGMERQAEMISGSANGSDALFNDISNAMVMKVTLSGEVKMQNKSHDGFTVVQIRGDGYFGAKIDSVNCVRFYPIEITAHTLLQDVLGGIHMQILTCEAWGTGEKAGKAKLTIPQSYDITPTLMMYFDNPIPQKPKFIFDRIGYKMQPEIWKPGGAPGPPPQAETVNDIFVLAFNANKAQATASMERDIEAMRDSANAINADKSVLEQAARDLQAGRITYPQFQKIQAPFMARAMSLNTGGANVVNKLKGFSLDLDWTPKLATYVHQRFDSRQVNPGHPEIVYGYITVDLSKRK